MSRLHAARGAVFAECAGAAFVSHYGDVAAETIAARRAGLADLSLLRRAGITGPDSIAVLKAAGLELAERPNTSIVQKNGDCLARLSAREFLHVSMSSLGAAADAQASSAWTIPDGASSYELPRADSHCLFALCGDSAQELMSRLCGVDLSVSRFANGDVAQTSLARVNSIVIRHDFSALH
ncbi:MAG: sarcosine oxidase, partial [Gammaproteobacteria bacterium]|nr:sarcosine oxidase [Gammaproteobacteria bacterium]